MDYGFAHNGKVYTPNATQGIDAETNEDRNKALEAAELAEWQNKPDRFLGYYHFPAETPHSFKPTPGFPYCCDICKTERHLSPELCEQSRQYRREFYPALSGATVSTWKGTTIGRIVDAKVYRHNFGSRMVSIRMVGTNGATYYGRASYDWGSCIKLKKSGKQ